MEAQMLEQGPNPVNVVDPSIGSNLEVPLPLIQPGELSRHLYTKGGKANMLVIKLESGEDRRFYYFESSHSAGWSPNRPPTHLWVLYNHDAIKRSRSEPVFYVETEPEADQLSALGLLATTFGRVAAVPPFQRDVLRGRTALAVGRAGADGEVHVNAVKGEYQSVATVRTLTVEHPSGPTPPGYRLADWLRDTAGEDQHDWLLAVARGERYPGRLPYIEPGGPSGAVSGADQQEGRVFQNAAQQAPNRSAQVLVFGVGARGQVGTMTVTDNPRPIQRPRRPGVVLSNDPSFGMEPEWLVQDVLPETGTGMIYAPSMAGKSFIGIDLCYAVENGLNWAGRDVKRGRAIYVSAEHSTSICRRANLQFQAQDMDRPFTVIRADSLGYNLAGDSGDVERLLEEIEYERGQDDVRLVFIDTFETIALGVEENSSSAVGQIWACFAKISARFNCFVLVAHHTGKSGENYRGSSTLMNRSETVIEVCELDSGLRRMEIKKQRDGLSGLTADFALDTVPGTSCCYPVFRDNWRIKRDSSSGAPGCSQKKPKDRRGRQLQSAILGALQDTWAQTGRVEMTKPELLKHLLIVTFFEGSSKDAARKALDRGLTDLEDQGLISRSGPSIRLLDTNANVPDVSASCPDNSEFILKRSA